MIIVQDPVGVLVSTQDGAGVRPNQLKGRIELLVWFPIRVAPHLNLEGLREAGRVLEEYLVTRARRGAGLTGI